MPVPFDPALPGLPEEPGMPNLSNLGIGQPQAVGNTIDDSGTLTPSNVEAAIKAFHERKNSLEAKVAAPSPKEQGPLAAAVASALAGILGGALVGAEGAGAMDQAFGVGSGLIGARNAERQKEHADQVAAAAKELESVQKVQQTVRMLLQSQPGLFKGEMMKFASSIAFDDTGLMASDPTKGGAVDPSSQMMIDALDFVIQSNDIQDPQILAQLHSQRAQLATGRKIEFVATDFLGDQIDQDKLMRDAINGPQLVARIRAGEKIDPRDIKWKASIKGDYKDLELDGLALWAKLQVENGMTEEDALQELRAKYPDLAVAVENKWGSLRLGGELDLRTVAQIAVRTYLGEGFEGEILGRNFPALKQALAGYIDAEREDREITAASGLSKMLTRKAMEYQGKGMSEKDAHNKALQDLKKEHPERFRELGDKTLQKLGLVTRSD